MRPLLVVAAMLWAGTARATQCEFVDEAVATRAALALAGNPDVIHFCEPCGDEAPGEPVRATRVEKTRDTTGDYRIVIDRREIDLAYTYVKTSPVHYENVAGLAGCPTSGVSPSLRVDDATTTGVMIRADATPVAPVVDPEPAPEPAPAPAPVVVVQQTTPSPIGWFQILMICCGTSSVWALGTIAFIRRKRRIAMRPRAAELVERSRF